MAISGDHAKLEILRRVMQKGEDGYQIVSDYRASLNSDQKAILDGEITRNIGNTYCGAIISKYNNAYPVWAFLEVIPFGRLVSFYGFCADRFSECEMKDNYYRLLTCKEIRNAAAHSNCLLNDLRAGTVTHKTNADVTKELMKISGMKNTVRKKRMSNARIQQIVTLLYMHKKIVLSDGIKKSEADELNKVVTRMFKNIDYYKTNQMIKANFDFLKLVIDNWFPKE